MLHTIDFSLSLTYFWLLQDQEKYIVNFDYAPLAAGLVITLKMDFIVMKSIRIFYYELLFIF